MRRWDSNQTRPLGYEPSKLTTALLRISYVIIIPHFVEPFQIFFNLFFQFQNQAAISQFMLTLYQNFSSRSNFFLQR